MKILGICCSPRKNSNTQIMLQTTLDAAQEQGATVELVALAGKTIAPCDACGTCGKTGKCHIKDDMQDIYPKIAAADGIILASPVYFWSVSGQAKVFIDRTYALNEGNKLAGKVGAAIAVADRSGGVGAIEVFNNYFTTTGMVVAGWAIGLSTLQSYENKKAVLQDERGLKRTKSLGRNIVAFLKSYQPPASV